MSDAHHAAPAPLGGPMVTPTTVTLAILAAIAVVILGVRFLYGMGAVSNISDGQTWGIWVVYDVMIGSAFACGGYVMAILVYIFNKGEYHPMVRPALLGSLFGYTLAGLSAAIDLGRYWNFWHVFWPGYAQLNSVMLEVALCVSAYILVMWIEFAPALLEKFGLNVAKKKLSKVLFFFIALGVVLPSMHQSSLGAMLTVFGYHVHPLWQSPVISLLFLMTAVTTGFAVVIFESCLSSSGFRRALEMDLMTKLSRLMVWTVAAYIIIRLADLAMRGAFGFMFEPGLKALMFWIEMIAFIVPVFMLRDEKRRTQPAKLFVAAVLLMAGAFLLRINAYIVGYSTGLGWSYFPSVPELMVSIGIIAIEILGYIVLVRYLPILPQEESI
ncbi:MAG TPA: Ni/Fe-hydrogenase cytochrome b subunit [Noviherbaspirillum sp.]|uniref:Ni/Fe-hydrogenase cytochrome b subunit n=1 Tax=Oxalobacteraceae TaxID=75682 RepID=UPI0010A41EFB|nr:Ni/Fe-hydrogenase cytochrome b subunit [Herbaspirillum sp. ST 5-3]HJV50054.1 Ni/Fe-hydrogenase cytochrome b subunit [Noviherbaspirillum sp.]